MLDLKRIFTVSNVIKIEVNPPNLSFLYLPLIGTTFSVGLSYVILNNILNHKRFLKSGWAIQFC